MYSRIVRLHPFDLIPEDLRKRLFDLEQGSPWGVKSGPKGEPPKPAEFPYPQAPARPRQVELVPFLMVEENAGGYHVTMLLPGVDPANVTVDLVAQAIRVTGRLPPHQVTSSQKTFTRTHTVPTRYQPTAENMTAELKHGVLSIRVTGATAPAKVTIPLRTE